ncbi:MAG: helix-turn-helix domain-containing protein [Kiritimatiellae bacterium]|nr:helix-turn-helix domain-containing protein [Kiritimatiellia bacterium]
MSAYTPSARGGAEKIPGFRPADVPDAAGAMRLLRLAPFVRQSGNDRRAPWFLGERRLLDYLAVFIASGQGHFSVGAEDFEVGPGDLVWIPPDTPHSMRGYPPVMHCLYVHFDLLYDPARSHWDAYIPSGTLDLSPFRRLMHPPVDDPAIAAWRGLLRVSNPGAIETRLRDICFEHRRSPSGSALLLSGMLLGLLSDILRGVESLGALTSAHLSDLRTAEAAIQSHLTGDLDVFPLAQAARLSCSHFRRLFRERFGESPRAMHRRARIRRACELLVYSNLNVSEIAAALGYSTVHNFSRAFSQIAGAPPSRYRRGGSA